MWSLGRPDAPPGEPLLVVDDGVVGATKEVLEAGVTLGMARREAEALAPFATVMMRDPGEETRRFEPVMAAIEDLVPRVEVVSPGLAYVSLTGAVRYYGGEEEVVARVVERLGVLDIPGGQARFGVADGPFAARWAAAHALPGQARIVGDTAAFLAGLDLSVLREGLGGQEVIDTFRWLGISTLGELSRLPREALATRFGTQGVLAHRLANGEDRPLHPREMATELTVEARFEDPLQTLDAVAFAARALSERLMRHLRRAGVAPHLVAVRAQSAEGTGRERVWRSADPLAERDLADRVWWQLRAWVESGGVPGGLALLRISPGDLSGEGRQLGLFRDESSQLEVERALARAQSLLGPDQVLQGSPQGGRLPAEWVAWSRWGETAPDPDRDPTAPWPGATPAPSPALVPPRPRPLEVEWDGGVPTRVRLGTRWEPVLTWAGPWRLTGRWWAGRADADRYQLVTSVGAFLCVVADGRAYLAGIYD